MTNHLPWIWKRWLRFGEFIGGINARIIFSLFYFTLFLPAGILYRLFADPFDKKARRTTAWKKKSMAGLLTLTDAQRQF